MFQIGKGLSWLSGFASVIGTICIILMMLHVTADVTMRFLFNMPLPGTITIVAHYYMIVVVFIGLGVAERQSAHISVEVVTDLLPKAAQGVIAVLAGLVTAGAFGLLMVRGWKEAMSKTAIGASIEQGSDMIPVWQSYWVLPLGAGLMVMIAVYRVLVLLTGSECGLSENTDELETLHD